MHKFNLLSAILFLLISVSGFTQEKLKLSTCFESAQRNHPLFLQKELQSNIRDLSQDNIKKDLLPQIVINAKATWQNEVISLPFEIPGFNVPELSQDQYRLSLDINQAIYRGGMYKKQKELENINSILEQLQIDKNLYALKNEVKSLFFAILLLDEQRKVFESYQLQIRAKLDKLIALKEEGAVISSALDGLRAEALTIKQQLNQLHIQRNSLMKNLEYLTQMDLSKVKELIVESPDMTSQKHQRLEMDYLNTAQNKLTYSKKLIETQKLPKVYAFASSGYGRPGFNYLSDNFSKFFMFGINFKWNILNWNKNNNEQKKIDVNIQIIETQKKEFEMNLQIALQQMRADIDKMEVLMVDDTELIRLRKSVADNASNQLNQGVITTASYIDELQRYKQAEINKKIHEIQLINRQLSYLNVLGKL